MNLKLKKFNDETIIDAQIKPAGKILLPSVTEGWRFNFRKYAKRKGCTAYILADLETPEAVEGCVIFEMRNNVEPYMAFIEVAPHNLGIARKYENVAGCLIAFACRLSFRANEPYKGWLAFDVMEEREEDTVKLMALYCKKYGAILFRDTTMVISPESGETLINRYLNTEL